MTNEIWETLLCVLVFPRYQYAVVGRFGQAGMAVLLKPSLEKTLPAVFSSES
jgi:hypothetical protein